MSGWWEVWALDEVHVYACFYGENSRKYAREHAKRLNALSKKEKPE